MSIDYDLIKTVHRVSAILNNEETKRRLRETARNPYPRDNRCAAVAKILAKKSGISNTEAGVYNTFPPEGLHIGNTVSLALLFADCFRYMSIARHKAIVSLMKQGLLVIVEGYNVDTDRRDRIEQIIVKA